MMKILIKNLEFKAIIGLLKKERKKPQVIQINTKIKSKNFLDYAILCKDIERIYKKHKFSTVEKSLKQTTKILKKKYFDIKEIDLKIYKMHIIKNALVGAEFKKKFKK